MYVGIQDIREADCAILGGGTVRRIPPVTVRNHRSYGNNTFIDTVKGTVINVFHSSYSSLFALDKRHLKGLAGAMLLEAIREGECIIHFIMLKNIKASIQ